MTQHPGDAGGLAGTPAGGLRLRGWRLLWPWLVGGALSAALVSLPSP